jgi:hypothetical protein
MALERVRAEFIKKNSHVSEERVPVLELRVVGRQHKLSEENISSIFKVEE